MYDVLIIGAGPAGIFTALELREKGRNIPIFENPEDFELRERRRYSKEEMRAFSLLFKDPIIVDEKDLEDGRHYVEIVVT